MKSIMLLAVIIGALLVPATAGPGGVPACAAAYPAPQQKFASVNSAGGTPGVPGPRGGPNSLIDWSPYGMNNGTALIGLCQSLSSPQ